MMIFFFLKDNHYFCRNDTCIYFFIFCTRGIHLFVFLRHAMFLVSVVIYEKIIVRLRGLFCVLQRKMPLPMFLIEKSSLVFLNHGSFLKTQLLSCSVLAWILLLLFCSQCSSKFSVMVENGGVSYKRNRSLEILQMVCPCSTVHRLQRSHALAYQKVFYNDY